MAIASAITAAIIAGAAGAGGTVAAAKSQAGASKRAAQTQERTTDQTIQFEREREARRQQEYDREQAEAAKRWQAEQEQARQRYDLDLEDRAFSRENALYDRQLMEEREARRAPYRAAGQAALQNLGQVLGLNFDMTTPAPRRVSAPPEPQPSAEDQKALALLGTLRQGLDPTSQNLGTLITGLNNAGIKATRARRMNNTMDSGDKIVLPSGYITDQIYDESGPGARWI